MTAMTAMATMATMTTMNGGLVIVESPAKCQKIQSYLGQGWKVIASLGHIRGLEQNLKFLEADFEPKYEYLKEKSKAIAQLKETAKQYTNIYLAADRDFEGEQIAYSVCLLLKKNPKNTYRITFTEITEKAVKEAIQNPGYIDMNRVHTQQARAMLDILIGFTMSPLLWKYVGRGLSAGRCQIPSLRLVAEREDAIRDFKVSSSWQLCAEFNSKNKNTFTATMEDELEDEESAQNYMEIVYQSPHGKIISKEIKQWTESAPHPLITSTLQQQASALYSINPKNTMKIAQRLYEAGHITYMRTDKAVLSEEAKNAAIAYVTQQYGERFVEEESKEDVVHKDKVSKNSKKMENAKNVQEAHEAIRPTHMEITDIEGDAYDKKVYRLIWQRTIQSVMSAAKGESCRIRIQLEGDTDFTWRTDTKRTTFEGWKCAGKIAAINDDLDDVNNSIVDKELSDSWSTISTMKVDDTVQWNKITAYPKDTKAQGRYTEATLVRELERHGIGRPSTFASLLSVIQEKNYVECITIPAIEITVKEHTVYPNKWPFSSKNTKKKIGAEKNKLVPTNLGRSVLAFMLKHFDDLFAYNFTGEMEKKLDLIAEGNGNAEGDAEGNAESDWKHVVQTTWESYKERYNKLLKSEKKSEIEKENKEDKEDNEDKEDTNNRTNDRTNNRIKEFKGGLKAVQTKKGPLLLIEGKTKEDTQFIGWPDRVLFEDMTEGVAEEFVKTHKNARQLEIIGEWNKNPIHKKSGKFGTYLQCNEQTIPYKEDESLEQIIERFEGKNKPINVLKEFKNYVIRTGQYGPYIIKTSLKKAVFVSLPKEINLETLTENEVEAIYKTGSEAKKNYVKNKK